jgi:hypothetical protein
VRVRGGVRLKAAGALTPPLPSVAAKQRPRNVRSVGCIVVFGEPASKVQRG